MTDNIGYGRPPESGRFKKGTSGNPQGRPKRRPTFRSDLEKELQAPFGDERSSEGEIITRQRAVIRALTTKAAESDMKAIAALTLMLKLYDVGHDEDDRDEEPEVDLYDLEALQRFIDERRPTKPSVKSNESK